MHRARPRARSACGAEVVSFQSLAGRTGSPSASSKTSPCCCPADRDRNHRRANVDRATTCTRRPRHPTTPAGPVRTPEATWVDGGSTRVPRPHRCRVDGPRPSSTASTSRPRVPAHRRGDRRAACRSPQRTRSMCRATRFSNCSWRPDVGLGSPDSSGRCSAPSVTLAAQISAPSGSSQPAYRSVRTPSSSPDSMIAGGGQQRPCHRVHPTDVSVEEVVACDRLAPQLAVEVEAAGGEPAPTEDLEHPQRHLLDADREAVDVPPEPVVAGVGIDRAEDPRLDRRRHLVGEIVTGQRGVVDLDVDPDSCIRP